MTELSPDRLALLELLLEEEGLDQPATPTIPQHPAGQPIPLTVAQERLWFLEQLDPNTPTLNISAAFQLDGQLNTQALESSLNSIIRRHSTLRTTFVIENRTPFQQIKPHEQFSLPIKNLATTAEIQSHLKQQSQTPFDLYNDPLHRITLFRLNETKHIFSIVLHHLISDGWSTNLLAQELGELYQAFIHNVEPDLPALSVQFSDYSAWEPQWLASEAVTHQLQYWRTQLADYEYNSPLPADYTRPPTQANKGAQVEATLTKELTQQVYRFSQAKGVTPFMTLLTTFKLLLHRHSQLDDIIIGSPIAGRHRIELEPLIGLFLNTLVLRTDVSGNPSFSQLLERVRQTCLDAYAHQDIPFEHLLAELNPGRDTSRTPYFQIFFNMLNFAGEAVSLPGLTGRPLPQPDLNAKFDLTFYVIEDPAGLNLLLVYNTDLYNPDRISELLEQYQQLLAQILNDPGQPLTTYSLVTPKAQTTLPNPTKPLNDTYFGPVHEAVTRWATTTPEKIALAGSTERWAYAQLEAQSNQIAHYLIGQGLAPQDRVAIYATRHPLLAIAVLGILKAGATFTIIDPAYPPGRNAKILHELQPHGWIELNPAGKPPKTVQQSRQNCKVILNLPTASLANYPTTPPSITCNANDPACITFTSGSTGTPKGVIGKHGSLSHFLPWLAKQFRLTSDERFAMLSGLAHDPIQRDIFTPLWLGATLYVPEPQTLTMPGRVAHWLKQNDITFANLTPATSQLIATTTNVTLDQLQHTILIGEALTWQDTQRLRQIAPNLTIINTYGTTETQRALSYHVIPSDPPRKQTIPLGKGMPGCQLLVLTANGFPAGIGEIGHLHIRSPHIALGYLNDPTLTKQRFRNYELGTRNYEERDPFIIHNSSFNLYSTGDLGRYLPDGTVEFIGRADHQFNIRGYRVEPGEITSALTQHPSIRESAIQRHNNQLHAYLVPTTPHTPHPTPHTLRSHLQKHLPDYMHPATFTYLPRLPLTPNGKLDYPSLPAPNTSPDSQRLQPPRDELEYQLAKIWEQHLNTYPIGIHDNFFDLGGHSLLAMRLFAQIEEAAGKALPLATLFQAPTIAQLATLLREEGWSSTWTSLVPVQPGGTKRPFFYVSPFLISILSLHNLARHLGEEQPLYGLQPQGLMGNHSIHTTIPDMAAHYIEEIQSLQPQGPYLIGGHCSGNWVALEIAAQLKEQGHAVHTLVLVDSDPPNIKRPAVNPLPYYTNRLSFYFKDGRLFHALRWKLQIALGRYVFYRVGRVQRRRLETVRHHHRQAYDIYHAPDYDGDLVLLRSADSAAFQDKNWHLRWAELTTGRFTHDTIPSTHANLLEEPYVQTLAEKISHILQDNFPEL